VSEFDSHNAAVELRKCGAHVTDWFYQGQPIDVDLNSLVLNECILRHLRSLHDVENLILNGTNIEDRDLEMILPWMSMKRLYLNDTSIGDMAMNYIRRLRNLFVLDIRNTLVTDTGLERLATGDCRLQWLGISGSKTTSIGIRQFQTSTGAWITEFDD